MIQINKFSSEIFREVLSVTGKNKGDKSLVLIKRLKKETKRKDFTIDLDNKNRVWSKFYIFIII
jgi:hypothetical protein